MRNEDLHLGLLVGMESSPGQEAVESDVLSFHHVLIQKFMAAKFVASQSKVNSITWIVLTNVILLFYTNTVKYGECVILLHLQMKEVKGDLATKSKSDKNNVHTLKLLSAKDISNSVFYIVR